MADATRPFRFIAAERSYFSGKVRPALRAKRLYEVATYEVEGFEVEAEGARRVFTRSTAKDKEGIEVPKWKRTAPDAKDLDTNKVQDALFAIGGVEALEFIDSPLGAAAYGLDQPALKVWLRFAGGKREDATD